MLIWNPLCTLAETREEGRKGPDGLGFGSNGEETKRPHFGVRGTTRTESVVTVGVFTPLCVNKISLALSVYFFPVHVWVSFTWNLKSRLYFESPVGHKIGGLRLRVMTIDDGGGTFSPVV